MIPKTTITKPIGTPPATELMERSSKVGICKGAGSVNVGKRVGSTVTANCAAKVGLIVAVNFGVGVGGGSMIGNTPALISTYCA